MGSQPEATEKAVLSDTLPTVHYDRQGAVDYAHFYTQGQGRRRDKYIHYVSGALDTLFTWGNPDYLFNFRNCANFLSQCLHEGGGVPMTEAWHHRFVTRRGLTRPHRPGRRILAGLLLVMQRIGLPLRRFGWQVTPAWCVAQRCHDYLTDPANGYLSRPCIPVTGADCIARVLERYPIRTGDVIFLSKRGRVYHSMLITRIADGEIYYSANKYTRYDMELSFGFKGKEEVLATIACLRDEMQPARPPLE